MDEGVKVVIKEPLGEVDADFYTSMESKLAEKHLFECEFYHSFVIKT